MDAAIQKAEARMTFVSKDKEALRAYQMREMALSDWTSGINYAKQEGRAEGRVEGEKQKTVEIARKMKAMGMTSTQITTATGLMPEEIERA